MDNLTPPAKPEEVARLEAVIAELLSVNEALVARVAELERRLGLDSSNSGKLPASNGRMKPTRTTSLLREPTYKKTGGQPGRQGRTPERRAAGIAWA